MHFLSKLIHNWKKVQCNSLDQVKRIIINGENLMYIIFSDSIKAFNVIFY